MLLGLSSPAPLAASALEAPRSSPRSPGRLILSDDTAPLATPKAPLDDALLAVLEHTNNGEQTIDNSSKLCSNDDNARELTHAHMHTYTPAHTPSLSGSAEVPRRRGRDSNKQTNLTNPNNFCDHVQGPRAAQHTARAQHATDTHTSRHRSAHAPNHATIPRRQRQTAPEDRVTCRRTTAHTTPDCAAIAHVYMHAQASARHSPRPPTTHIHDHIPVRQAPPLYAFPSPPTPYPRRFARSVAHSRRRRPSL